MWCCVSRLAIDPAIFETAVQALAEGNSLRATTRIVQIDIAEK